MSIFDFLFFFYHKKYESAKLTAFDFFFPQRPLPIARSVSLLKGCGKEVEFHCPFAVFHDVLERPPQFCPL